MTPAGCAQQVYAGSLLEPPEFCDDIAEPDEDYCAAHLREDDLWARADEAYARRKEGGVW